MHSLPRALATTGVSSGPSSSFIPLYRPHEQYMMGAGRATMGVHFVDETIRQALQQRRALPLFAGSLDDRMPAVTTRR